MFNGPDVKIMGANFLSSIILISQSKSIVGSQKNCLTLSFVISEGQEFMYIFQI